MLTEMKSVPFLFRYVHKDQKKNNVWEQEKKIDYTTVALRIEFSREKENRVFCFISTYASTLSNHSREAFFMTASSLLQINKRHAYALVVPRWSRLSRWKQNENNQRKITLYIYKLSYTHKMTIHVSLCIQKSNPMFKKRKRESDE